MGVMVVNKIVTEKHGARAGLQLASHGLLTLVIILALPETSKTVCGNSVLVFRF